MGHDNARVLDHSFAKITESSYFRVMLRKFLPFPIKFHEFFCVVFAALYVGGQISFRAMARVQGAVKYLGQDKIKSTTSLSRAIQNAA